MILVVLLEKEAIPVHRQGFFCNDNSIKFPYQKEETVPGKWMFGINYGLSIILYLIGETCFYRQSPHNENQNEEVSTPRKSNCQLLKRISKLIFSLTWCMAATLMITSVIKSTVGSLRPHFMDVCTPNVDCTQYSKDIYVLRTPNKHPMRMPIDFKKPRTPGRQPACDRYTIASIHSNSCFTKLKWAHYSQDIYSRMLTPINYVSFSGDML